MSVHTFRCADLTWDAVRDQAATAGVTSGEVVRVAVERFLAEQVAKAEAVA